MHACHLGQLWCAARPDSMACSDVAAVLTKLKQENRHLQESLSDLDGPKPPHFFNISSSTEHLERELQRARGKHDQALQRRQQQVAELEQLTVQCQEMLQGSGSQQKQSPVERTVAQLEAQLAAASRHTQCAVSMQHYLQQAEQQHKQELQEAELQVQQLKEALDKSQRELQEVKDRLIKAKTNRAAAKQAATKGEQQLAAARDKRSTLQRQLAQQCESLLPDGAAAGWQQLVDMCADMPAQQWVAEALELAAVLQDGGHLPTLPHSEHGADALSCLHALLVHTGSTNPPELAAWMKAQLQSSASLQAALEETKQYGY